MQSLIVFDLPDYLDAMSKWNSHVVLFRLDQDLKRRAADNKLRMANVDAELRKMISERNSK